MAMNERLNERCLCGSTRPFKRCCEPYLTGKAFAPTAEALMRSRYSAFVQGHIDYLMSTHHADHHGVNARASLKQSIANTRWLNLAVLKTFVLNLSWGDSFMNLSNSLALT